MNLPRFLWSSAYKSNKYHKELCNIRSHRFKGFQVKWAKGMLSIELLLNSAVISGFMLNMES